MILIEVKDLVGNRIHFEVSNGIDAEVDSLELDDTTLQWLTSVSAERPFKPKPNEAYSLHVVETVEWANSPVRELKVEIRRGKSRVKRTSEVPETVWRKFRNFFHHQKLPSELV